LHLEKWLSVIRNAFWEMADAGDFGGSVLEDKLQLNDQ
jgi:hypothetical protein